MNDLNILSIPANFIFVELDIIGNYSALIFRPDLQDLTG